MRWLWHALLGHRSKTLPSPSTPGSAQLSLLGRCDVPKARLGPETSGSQRSPATAATRLPDLHSSQARVARSAFWIGVLATSVLSGALPAAAAGEVCRKELDAGVDGTIDATIHIGRDPSGRVVSETTRRSDGTLKRIVRYRYDAAGRLVEAKVGEGDPTTFEETTTYVYDGAARLSRTSISQLTRSDGRELHRLWETTHRYDPKGRPVQHDETFSQRHGEATLSTQTLIQLRYGPDGKLVAERRQVTLKGGAKAGDSRVSYRYADDGDRRRIVREERDGERPEPSERLVRVLVGSALEREEREWRGPSGETSRHVVTFKYAAAGELLEELHDADGDGEPEFVYRYRYECGR